MRSWLPLLLTLLLAAAGPADLPARAADPVEQLFPNLAQMPAPSWLRPGIRLTYRSMAASVPGGSHYYYRDEKGNWVGRNRDDKGKYYERGEQPGTGGQGFTTVDVVAMEQGRAVLSVSAWGEDPGSGAVYPLGAAPLVGPAGGAGGWWVHPQALAGLADQQAGDVRIVRYAHPVNGQNVPAIRIELGNRGSWVYDLSSGVLLLNSTAAVSREKTHTWSGDSLALGQSSYLGARLVNVPWAEASAPAWLQNFRGMAGDGRVVVSQPGVGAMPIPMSFDIEVTGRGPRWVAFRLTSKMQGMPGMPNPPQEQDLVSGAAQIGGIWVPPGGLAGLRPGQVLDRDPHTKITQSILRAGPRELVIGESGRIYSVEYVYDLASGGLLSVKRAIRVGVATQTTELWVRNMR